MILKIAGCICIILGACAYGYCTGLEYKRHVEELEYLNRLICQLSGEISYTKAPLAEVFQRVAGRVREPYSNWLLRLSEEMGCRVGCTFGTLWEELTRENLKSLSLISEERTELENLGSQMGHLDIRMQEQTLSWYAKGLEERREILQAGLTQKQRLANCLGAAGGIFLVIVLI